MNEVLKSRNRRNSIIATALTTLNKFTQDFITIKSKAFVKLTLSFRTRKLFAFSPNTKQMASIKLDFPKVKYFMKNETLNNLIHLAQ